jgi:hypothetical protein
MGIKAIAEVPGDPEPPKAYRDHIVVKTEGIPGWTVRANAIAVETKGKPTHTG